MVVLRASILLIICIIYSNLFEVVTVSAARLPTPPVFAASAHFPSICYLPPESGICGPFLPDVPRKRKWNDANNKNNNDEGADDGEDNSVDDNVFLTRYYFDTSTELCYPFAAQNCGGNENRFETKEECLAKCRIETMGSGADKKETNMNY